MTVPSSRTAPVRASTTKTSTTAFLLTCAALAVAGGVLNTANGLLQVAALAVLPQALAVLLGLSVWAPTVALYLLRRPGSALITAVVAALLALPFSPAGAGAFQAMGSVLLGVLLELAYACTRYRRFPVWLSAVGGLLVGAMLVGVHWKLWGMSTMTPAAADVMVVLIVVGTVGWSLLGAVVGRRLHALGVAQVGRRTR